MHDVIDVIRERERGLERVTVLRVGGMWSQEIWRKVQKGRGTRVRLAG